MHISILRIYVDMKYIDINIHDIIIFDHTLLLLPIEKKEKKKLQGLDSYLLCYFERVFLLPSSFKPLTAIVIVPTISNKKKTVSLQCISLFPVARTRKENSRCRAPLPRLQESLLITLICPHSHPLPKYSLPSQQKDSPQLQKDHTDSCNKQDVKPARKTKAIANITWMCNF